MRKFLILAVIFIISGCSENEICNPNPCKNTGICNEKEDSYTCQCKEGFEGANCEIDVNECKNDTHDCGTNALGMLAL